MLTIQIPEETPYGEILADVKANPVYHNGIAYYPDGRGGMPKDPEVAARTAYEWSQHCCKAWADLARILR